MPRGPDDPALTAADLRDYFEVEGDFRLVAAAEPLGGRATVQDPVLAQAGLPRRRNRWCGPALFADSGDARHGRALALAVRGRSLSAMARRSARRSGRWCGGPRPTPNASASSFIPLSRPAPMNGRACRRRSCWSRIMAPSRGGWARPRTRAAARAALGLDPDRFTAVYAGRINAQKGLDALLARRRTCGRTCCFCWSARRAKGRSRRRPAGAPMSRSCPGRRRPRLPAWLHAADVLLIPPSRAPLEQFAIACCR